MRLINARFPDMCLDCGQRVIIGELIFWTSRQTFHKDCYLEREIDENKTGKPNAVHAWLLNNGMGHRSTEKVS